MKSGTKMGQYVVRILAKSERKGDYIEGGYKYITVVYNVV